MLQLVHLVISFASHVEHKMEQLLQVPSFTTNPGLQFKQEVSLQKRQLERHEEQVPLVLFSSCPGKHAVQLVEVPEQSRQVESQLKQELYFR